MLPMTIGDDGAPTPGAGAGAGAGFGVPGAVGAGVALPPVPEPAPAEGLEPGELDAAGPPPAAFPVAVAVAVPEYPLDLAPPDDVPEAVPAGDPEGSTA